MMNAQERRLLHHSRSVLLLVLELHLRGYQSLRALPGLATSGMYWRCAIAPASLVSTDHGARLADNEDWDNPLIAKYTTGDEGRYFGWIDAERSTPSGLARRFEERFPAIVEAGRGSDWTYTGWYVEMLHLTYPDRLPYAYSGGWDPEDCIPTDTVGDAPGEVRIPLPPPGTAPVRTEAP